MNHPASASSRTSSTPASDTLRPRVRKLISGLDDDEDTGLDAGGVTSGRVASPRHSRPTSPLPTKHPSRTSVRDPPRSTFSSEAPGKRLQSPGGLTSLWGGSWSSLQGLASSFLGGETAGSAGNSRTGSRSRPSTMLSSSKPRSGIPTEWGPSESIQVGSGTNEERDALIRAAKRKELLRANGHGMVDASGRHKRRTSDDFTGLTGSVQPSEDNDRDALVYLHHVKPNDTFIGLTIKYNCQAADIRKANRLWPNDPIQSRSTILLPVDACGVKGRPVPGPEPIIEEQDLLGDPSETISMHESPKESPPDFVNGWHKALDHEDTARPSSSLPTSCAGSTAGDPLELHWKHESWVLLPSEKEPVEIVRLPRRHLGYFPRARRKSNPYSDLGTPRMTPTTSLDIPRIPPSPGSAQSEAYAALRPSPSRRRSHSNAHFPSTSLFSGPGGIGSLSKNASTIGPAKDRLNELLGPHLPNVAPPPQQTVFTPWNPGIRDEDLMSFGEASPAIPVADATHSDGLSSIDFQEMTGKVERWVRKTVKKAGSAYAASASASASRGIQGMAAGSGVGDLIELTDSFEIGEGNRSDDLIDVGHQGEGSSAAEFGAEGMRGRRMVRQANAHTSDDGRLKGGKGD
ncbi:uncharacterized protein PV09_03091 [Verruconis gallopava]|uniref:LysM domain-containing protein n=1 Tax=Verruconis gallopava TaxID=253628 RepID=A0A0D1YYY2_9PEZI|nr:uncharacterized protein PV09_03091 [Verruconis gallopava]KIW05897.1 hypothetical protein PV09_03091 [Verruconis gallopava]